MSRDFVFVECDRHSHTPDESFAVVPPSSGRQMYKASTEFSLEHLGKGSGRKCLLIGSPVFAVGEFVKRGWNVTYIDVRIPPIEIDKFIQCDATNMGIFPDCSFDAIETSCVLSHAGMGRYGDPIVEDGDEKMLSEMFRVMKPGSLASVMFGNIADIEKMVVLGTCHRIYTMAEIERLLGKTGFVMEKNRIWSLRYSGWLVRGQHVSKDYLGQPDYISVLIRKPNG